MENNFNIGEVLLVNTKYRTAIVLDETQNKIIEVPLFPIDRDFDTGANTHEEIPKEGSRVFLGRRGSDVYIVGPYTTLSYSRQIDDAKIQRKLTNVNQGNPNFYGVITDDMSPQDGFTNFNGASFGGHDPLNKDDLGKRYNYAGNSYDDLMPGDKVLSTKDGNALGVLEGGVTLFKASELCQIIGIRYNDLLRIVSRNFEHFTDFGNLTIRNEKGATSFVLEGAASSADVHAGRMSLRVELGSAGEMIKLTVLNGASEEIAMYHMKSSGDIEEVSKNYLKRVYGKSTTVVYGNSVTYNQKNYEEDTVNNYVSTIHGNEERTISGNRIVAIKGDDIRNVGRNITHSIGGTRAVSISGPWSSIGSAETVLIAKGDLTHTLSEGNYNITVNTVTGVNGKLTIKVGIPFAENTISIHPVTGITVEDVIGNMVEMKSSGIKLTSKLGAELNLSNSGGKVALGNLSAELLDLVDQFLEKVVSTETEIMSHIHATVVGPTAPPRNAAQFQSLQVQINRIRTQLNLIKGSL